MRRPIRKTTKAYLLLPGDEVVVWSARRQSGVKKRIKRVDVDGKDPITATTTITFLDGGREVVRAEQEIHRP